METIIGDYIGTTIWAVVKIKVWFILLVSP